VWLVLLVALLALDGFDALVGAPTFNPLHPRAAHVHYPAPLRSIRLHRVCTITIRRVNAATGTTGPAEHTGCYSVTTGGPSIGAGGISG
jgi:hypothetical protein